MKSKGKAIFGEINQHTIKQVPQGCDGALNMLDNTKMYDNDIREHGKILSTTKSSGERGFTLKKESVFCRLIHDDTSSANVKAVLREIGMSLYS
ncbi:hypothetical protein CHS0354_040026 [Potamilus streckersoni]|uniref:Uncharacterized protein n=1 Tax=Potamilus streckersoni TaxID=2493646 RepID=A0AAE0SU83_9BIVA|nr:hypothetical protein CHS0354_040026 [Potamilus streckersoni]